jgi:hypothetical protein
MKKKEIRSFKCELRSEPEAPSKIVGYAAVYDSLSVDLGGFRERLRKGAFRSVLESPDLDVVANCDHDNSRILGRFRRVGGTVTSSSLRIAEDDHGLKIEFDIPDTTLGNDITYLMREKIIDQMSFAFNCEPEAEVWTREDGNEVREITEVCGLYDISLVVFPAYEATEAQLRSKQINNLKSTNQLRWEITKRILRLHS